MKKLFLLLIFIPLVSFGQDINKESNGYTEVVEVKLTKKEIHQKINEWIAVNYKSAQDVIQLNTEDKVITKGNFTVNFRVRKYVFTYRIHNSLTFSIRDNKYKIDLVPNRVSSDLAGRDVDTSFLTQYISSTVSTKDEFIENQEKLARNVYLKMGYSEKKTQKWINKASNTWEDSYDSYLLNKSDWDNEIKSTFQSIKDYVSKSDNQDW
jgi:hypothetical protein